jgi:hypothetical protein
VLVRIVPPRLTGCRDSSALRARRISTQTIASLCSVSPISPLFRSGFRRAHSDPQWHRRRRTCERRGPSTRPETPFTASSIGRAVRRLGVDCVGAPCSFEACAPHALVSASQAARAQSTEDIAAVAAVALVEPAHRSRLPLGNARRAQRRRARRPPPSTTR